LPDGWYCLPSFRFLGLTAFDRRRAHNGFAYASPAMMALANLLSHPKVGAERIGESIGGRSLLRSAKDLGRVLALARLASRDDVEAWAEQWASALQKAFPVDHRELAARAGNGLRALIQEPHALEDARHAVDVGLLAGYQVTVDELRAIARQIFADAIEPLARRWARR
jgi:hypothetical protein